MADLDAIQAGLVAWVAAGTGLPASQVMWTGGRRPSGTYVELDIQTIDPIGGDWTSLERNPIALPDVAVETVDGDRLRVPAHPFVNGIGPVQLTGMPPAPLQTGVRYWLIVDDADHVRVAQTYKHTGGWHESNPRTAIALLDTGGGCTIVRTSRTVRPGEELKETARGTRSLTLALQCFASPLKGALHARAVLSRLVDRRMHTSMLARLSALGLGLGGFTGVQSIAGVVNTTEFEARAITSCTLWFASEESETLGNIESAMLRNDDTGREFTFEVGRP